MALKTWHTLFAALLALFILHCRPASAREVVWITILHTNDVLGYLTGPEFADASGGGLARIASLLPEARKDNPNTLLLDAGNSLAGNALLNCTGGKPAIAAMNYMKYDGMGLGKTDLLWSKETLFQRIREAHFPVLAANLRVESAEILSPHAIKEIGGVRVALLGIVPPLSTEPGKSGEWCGLVVEKPAKALRDVMAPLRDQADLFVLVSPLGASENEKLAQEIPGIHVILSAGGGAGQDSHRWVGDTLIAQADSFGKSLGRIDIILRKDPQGRFIVSSVQGKRGFFWNSRLLFPGHSIPNSALLPVGQDVPQDPGFLRQIAPYQEELYRLMEEEVAFSDSTLEGIGATHRSTNLGNLLCDILREACGTDISLMDSDLLEGKNLPRGVVRGKDLLRLLDSRSNQQILTGHVSGDTLLEILEESVAGTMEGRPLLMQASGVAFEYDTGRPSGHRVVRAWVRSSPLERGRIYSVATPSSLLAGKIAGSAFSRVGNIRCTNKDLFSVILEGMRKKEKISWQYGERAVRIVTDFRERTSQGKPGK